MTTPVINQSLLPQNIQNQAGSESGQPLTPSVQIPGTSGKSPVSAVHELAVQLGETLEWMQVSECGPAHCKLFSMKVTMGSYEAIGSGRSKKIAKQVAAQSLLLQIQESSKTQHTNATQQHEPQLPATTNTPAHENPVSTLQQVTAKHGLGLPEYQVVCEDGPHILQKFDIKVKVKDMESSGLGRSKKTAKRNAAQAMLDQLSKTNSAIEPPKKRITFVPALETPENNGGI